MMIKLLISLLLFQLLLVQTFPQEPLKCKNPRSKICLLQKVTAEGSEVPQFPDLAEKHTIHIRSGNVPLFTDKITSQFGGVTKVTLGRLNIESLHIPDSWITLNAESNQIRELIVDKSSDCSPEDGYQRDAPDVPVDESEDAFVTEGSVVVHADAKDSEPGLPADPSNVDEDELTTAKPEDIEEKSEDSKKGVEQTPKPENAEIVKEGVKGTKSADSKEGAKAESRLEHLEDSKEVVQEGAKDENPADSKAGAKAESRLEQPEESKEGVEEEAKDENPADSTEGAKAESRLEQPEDSKKGVKEGVKDVKPSDSKKDDNVQSKSDSPEDSKDTTPNAKKSVDGTIGTQPSPVNLEKIIPPEPLVGYQLRSLNLANNKLRSIKELKCMVHLQELRLDGNELEFIEMATFIGMTKLKKLSLAKNKISLLTSPQPMELPSLEWFSLASNRLTTLQIVNWNMAQLVDLDVSHNTLVQLDQKNFKQFVSLERLALANNSWSCFWLNGALKEISKYDFITLIDRDDDAGDCPNGLPVEGICCSSTLHEDDDSTNANLHDRIQRFQQEQASMDSDLKEKMGSFRKEWNDKWETVDQAVAERRKRLEAKEKEPQDDSKVTDKDIRELHELIDDCNSLLKDMESLRDETALTAQSFTEAFYTTIALKNKLLAAMRDSSKLKNDLHQYEISFKAEVK